MGAKKLILNVEYIRNLPDDSLLSTNEVAKVLGYASSSSVGGLLARGKLPKPDFITNRMSKPYHKHYWRVSTIRKFVRELNVSQGIPK